MILDAAGGPTDPEAQAAGAVLPLGAALLADLSVPGGPGVGLLALTFPDRDLALAAAAHMERAWATVPSLARRGVPFGNIAGPAHAYVTGKGPFVALLVVADPGLAVEGRLRNRAFDTLYEAVLQRDLVFLPQP